MKVGELHGYIIEYNTSTRRFEAWKDGETITSAPTQAEVEEIIKKLHKKGFQRVKVIRAKYEDAIIGEITSVNKVGGYREIEAWFVSQDERGESHREKIYLGDSYQATTKNLEIAEKIKELNDKRGKLMEKIEELKKKLTDPVTKENIYKLAGLEG